MRRARRRRVVAGACALATGLGCAAAAGQPSGGVELRLDNDQFAFTPGGRERWYSHGAFLAAASEPVPGHWDAAALHASCARLLDCDADARVLRDFRRFRYFSAGWVAPATADPSVLGDARYSLRPDGYEPIWGIRLHPGAQPPSLPVEWVDHTARNRVPVSLLWQELTGAAPGYMALPVR